MTINIIHNPKTIPHIGDVVKIKSNLIVNKFYGKNDIAPDMKCHFGKTTRIKLILPDDQFKLKADMGRWKWTKEMLEYIEK